VGGKVLTRLGKVTGLVPMNVGKSHVLLEDVQLPLPRRSSCPLHHTMLSLQSKGRAECQSKHAFEAAVSKPRSRGTETHVLGKGGPSSGVALAYHTSSATEEMRWTMASGKTVLPPLECVCVHGNDSIGFLIFRSWQDRSSSIYTQNISLL
jgi:hypothetical protein